MARRRRLRLVLVAVIVACPLLAGGWLWFRNSTLVAVRRVEISGVHGPDATAIDAALSRVARRMSTLDVHAGGLRAAVAPFPIVREIRTSAKLPHELRIRVVEQLPVAALVVAHERTAVAADGVVLGPALLSSSLPTLDGTAAIRAGRRVHGSFLLAALAVLGAAPSPLANVVAHVFTWREGLTVAMRNGLLAYFGDASRPRAKWQSLARVLADPSSQGALYVDVRLPERPAAGFVAGAAPEDLSASAATAGDAAESGPEAAAAALDAGLQAAVGVESGAGGEGSTAWQAQSTAPSEGAAAAPTQAAPAPTQAAGTTPTEAAIAPASSSPAASQPPVSSASPGG